MEECSGEGGGGERHAGTLAPEPFRSLMLGREALSLTLTLSWSFLARLSSKDEGC
jgi:hypothetical protein